MKKNIFTGLLLLLVSHVGISQPNNSTDTLNDNSSWFSKSLEYKGIAVQDDAWHIWGCSPIIGPMGKTHLFVARWPEKTGHQGWYTDSQVAHYVGDTPEGPFKFSDIVLEGTGKETWDKFAPHNPTIHKVGDRYALFYIANTGKEQRPRNQKIGLATSKSLYGPWKKAGEDGLILSPPTDSTYYNFGATNGVVNPAFLQHPDGRFFLYFKSNDMRKKDHWKPMMGLAIADKLEGPYKQLKNPVTKNNSVIEDGYAFNYNNKVYLVTTDNHGMIEFGGGLIWESEDGMSFSNPKQAFKRLAHYFGGTLPEQTFLTKGEIGSKFERPQILMIDGKPSYLYCPSGTNTNGGKGSAGYVLKIRKEFLPVAEKYSHKYESNWESLRKHKIPQWAIDAKFGIYAHLGPYTQTGAWRDNPNINWGNYYATPYQGIYGINPAEARRATFEKRYGSITAGAGYRDLCEDFNAGGFDPEMLADLIKRSNARYAGICAIHHDGYAMWDSEVTPHCAGKTGSRRDLLGEVLKAIKSRGLKTITTFHHARTYQHFQQLIKGLQESNITGVDILDPENHEYYWFLGSEERFAENRRKLTLEVIDKYKPDVIWFDGGGGSFGTEEILAYYFNMALKEKMEVCVHNKGRNFGENFGLYGYENGHARPGYVDWPWGDDTHSAVGWCDWPWWYGIEYKKPGNVVLHLCDLVARNGSLLLSINPRPDGSLDQGQIDLLEGIGEWLKQNGDAIYGTTPWTIFAEGHVEPMFYTQTHPDKKRVSRPQQPNISKFDTTDIRFVTKDNVIYATQLGIPKNGKTIMKSLGSKTNVSEKNEITSVELLGYGSVRFKRTMDKLIIQLPKKLPNNWALSFRIKVSGVLITRGNRGTNTIMPK